MTSESRAWTHDPGDPLVPVTVGAVTVVPVVQLHYRANPAVFFRSLAKFKVDHDAWYWQPPYLDDGLIVIDIGGFLVRAGSRTILVDAGMGNGKVRPNPLMNQRRDEWFTTLRRAGATPDSIDTVIFTHLHGDHVGFATRQEGGRWVPVFERARHLVAAAEFEHWTSSAARPDLVRLGDYISDTVLPLRDAGLLDLVDPDMQVCEGVRLVSAPGHTPGNVCVEIESEGQRAVFAGDMIHHAVQLAFPELNTDYCVDQPAAARARQALLSNIASDSALLFPAHFPGARPGRVVPDGHGGYRYVPVPDGAA